MLRRIAFALAVASLAAVSLALPIRSTAQSVAVAPALFQELHWRNIGPFRGGRTNGVAGAGDGVTYYTGAVGGGVWKTVDAGRTWNPVMDAMPVSSIGAIAVAPSDPNVVYAGSGEADMRSDIIHGNGMYRSTDAGATWTHIGLDDSQQIGRILVAPHDPKTLLVAALGHAYAANAMRGVYRSSDGGATWTRVLFKDENTGAIDLAADPAMHVVYASLWQTRRPPWSVYPPANGPGTGLYKSTDGGLAWTPVTGGGFPSDDLGKVGLAVAPSDPQRVYAIVDAKRGGLYRSDDEGATWRLLDADPRLWERGWYFCHIAVDPKNADDVYVSDTSVYRSTDGGAHFTAIKGSPDGDDFHSMWIDPNDPAHLAVASDQGTSVSVDGARTWSSWFNQPTGQFYHVATDASFPFRLFGAQQDSGAAMIVSRSNHRDIEQRDWQALSAGGESDSLAPDPADPEVVFGGEVVREDLRTHQVRDVSPTAGKPGVFRKEWTSPLAFGPNRALYTAHQMVFRSLDDGEHWEQLGGDLTRPDPGTPPNLDPVTAADATLPGPRGVVLSVGPSFRDPSVVWAGTDDGLVRLTRDGGATWLDVTPPGLAPWSRVYTVEPSPFDAATAYVAVDRHRLDDDKPYVFITNDYGKTWRSANAGIPDGSFVRVVRADPVQRGLLYAATETQVFVSFDDGVAWQSLRLNMPYVSVRDLKVHDGDLAIATHGRAFWVLDDVEPLRELAGNASAGGARLFAPLDAHRTRDGDDEAEASPPETPAGENPPNGAYLDYVVPSTARGPVTLAILDAAGRAVRSWSSSDTPQADKPDDVPYPAFWIRVPRVPSAAPGMHRFVWNFHERRDDGPLAPPGTYTVRLGESGETIVQHFRLRRDPRIAASDADLIAQADLARAIDDRLAQVQTALTEAARLRSAAEGKIAGDAAQIDAIAGPAPVANPRNSVGTSPASFETLRAERGLLHEVEDAVESADAAPTAQQRQNWSALDVSTQRTLEAWKRFAATRHV